MSDEMREEMLKVIYAETGKRARIIEIEDSLAAMQDLVGGTIEEYMPWKDDAALICNEEGKLRGLPLNRGIFSEDGELQDVIAGDFFICYAPVESERFQSLPPELEEKYRDKFDYPEKFFRVDDEIRAIKYDPDREVRDKDEGR